jgi:hypothetical protein
MLELAVVRVDIALKKTLPLVLAFLEMSSIACLILFKVNCAFSIRLSIHETSGKGEAVVIDSTCN